MELTTDDWSGAQSNHNTTESPTWAEIEAAVLALDNSSKTLVTLSRGIDSDYICAGGGDGRYFVFIFTADQVNVILTAPSTNGDPIELCCGGQVGTFPRSQVVDLDAALKAFRTYFERGTPEPSLTWLRE